MAKFTVTLGAHDLRHAFDLWAAEQGFMIVSQTAAFTHTPNDRPGEPATTTVSFEVEQAVAPVLPRK